jgi:putative transposase
MADSNGAVRRRRRSSKEWQSLLSRFAASGLSVAAFCRRESVSTASFQRWRRLVDGGAGGERLGETPAGFVDLGTLVGAAADAASSGRLEVRLELGGGVVLHLVRG